MRKNTRFFVILFTFTLFLLVIVNSGLAIRSDGQIEALVLYDNYIHTKGKKVDWGYACLVKGLEKTILFDTGTKSEILLHNVSHLGFDLTEVDCIVLSHEHGDHTGGLSVILDKNPDVTVYVPVSFTKRFVQGVEASGAKVVRVAEPIHICKNAVLTGELGNSIKEIALTLKTGDGIVMITGCSHPGIVEMLEEAEKLHSKKIFFVFGGFHLMQKSNRELREIIKDFKKLGVKKVGATHCTGDEAIARFKEAYGKDFVPIGVGKRLVFSPAQD